MITALILILFASLPVGQLGSVTILPGVSLYLQDMVLLILSGVTVVNAVKQKIQFKLSKYILLFVLVSIASLVVNTAGLITSQLLISSLYLGRLILYAAIYFLVIIIRKPAIWWLEGLFISGVLIAVLGFLQYVSFPNLYSLTFIGWDPHYYRLTSTFLDPNFVGIYIVLTILAGFMVLGEHRFVNVIMTLILLIALYLTRSRSSFLAFGMGMTIFAVVSRKYYLFLIAVVLAAVVVFGPQSKLDVTNIIRPYSTLARLNNWNESIRFISRAPLFGVGFNTLRYTGPYIKTDSTPVLNRTSGGIDNSLLVVGATTGLLGFAVFITLLYQMMRNMVSAYRNPKTCGIGMMCLSGLGAILVHSMFNNSIFYPWVMVWIWVLAGAAEKSSGDI